MATRAEVDAAKKKQLKDGKNQKDLEKGRKINKEKSTRKAEPGDRNQFIDIKNKKAQTDQKEAARKLQSKVKY